jgi:hypothetical protein
MGDLKLIDLSFDCNYLNWLKITMSISERELENIINQIYLSVDPSSQFHGRLLNWKGDDSFWHYGIGLSGDKIFDTGRGIKSFNSCYVEVKCVRKVEDIAFSHEKIIRRLIYALKRFGEWEYGLLGWNCLSAQHLARLVANNRAISYEVKKQPWPIPHLNHGGKHPHAEKDFQKYLSKNDPTLLDRSQI